MGRRLVRRTEALRSGGMCLLVVREIECLVLDVQETGSLRCPLLGGSMMLAVTDFWEGCWMRRSGTAIRRV